MVLPIRKSHTMRQFKYQNLLIFFIFLFLAFGFFGINLSNFFLSDDFDFLYIAKNTKNVFSYFLTNYWGERNGGIYAPFLNLLFYFEYKIWNLNPFGYHLTNLLFHIGSAFFVFLIGRELFRKKWTAFLAGFLFLIFPAHAEAVNWISARPHVVGTFFYLVCLWGYLKFRKDGGLKFIAISLASFILSLLTKELALTLPFAILVLEILNFKFKKFSVGKNWQWVATFFILFGAYILIRYLATSVLFGYYAQESFVLKVSQIFKTFVSGITGLISWGSARIFLTELFLNYKILFLILVFLVILLLWAKREKWQTLSWDFLSSFVLFVIPFGLILFLQFSPTSDEGERYLYLPSVGFCLLLGFVLTKVFKKKVWLGVFAFAVAVYFSVFLINKNLIWREASQISKKIVSDFGKVVNNKSMSDGFVFFSLPDTYEGAQVFRNGIKLAINLYYPEYHPEPVIFLPVYLRLDKSNKGDKIINWEMGKNCDYIFGVSRLGNQELTGFDRKETENYIFELWGYNYLNFTSNVVKLKLKEPIKELIRSKKVYFLMYSEGRLKEFEWKLLNC